VIVGGPAAIAGLHAFADACGNGVVNTWGAKGIYEWNDPHHFGTVGLQARDFELAGLGDVEVLITTGLDPAEVTSQPWEGRAEVIDLHPLALADAAQRLTLPPGCLDQPAFYGAIAAVVGPMYTSEATPPPAARLAAQLAADLPEGGIVVAEPGLVGFWVARTFPTSVAGSVIVPAAGGVAAAHARAAVRAAAGEPVVLVTERASDAPKGVRCEVWSPEEIDLDPAPLVAVAGEIVAWGGLAGS
jgi:thiamine pyrophosphate-dependent acetolactate synthase large subunit-like protein